MSDPPAPQEEPKLWWHSLTLEFRRVLSEAEWREVVEAARQLPFVQGLRADAVPAQLPEFVTREGHDGNAPAPDESDGRSSS